MNNSLNHIDSDFLSWLHVSLKSTFVILEKISEASDRYYIRLNAKGRIFIGLHSSLSKTENTSFVDLAKAYREINVVTPDIIDQDLSKGFMLIEDLGSKHLLDVSDKDIIPCYKEAILNLYNMRRLLKTNGLIFRDYGSSKLKTEINLMNEWFFNNLLSLRFSESDLRALSKFYHYLVVSISSHKKTLVHLDYHSKNLMCVGSKIAVLDFQDSCFGSAFYDIASLLRDVYVQKKEPVYNYLLNFAYDYLFSDSEYKLPFDDFVINVEICALQRHFKILGIFSRIKLQRNNDSYMQYIPMTLHYIIVALKKYDPNREVLDLFQDYIIPSWEKFSA